MGIAQFQRIVFIVLSCNFLQHIIAHQIQRRDIFQCYRMPAYCKTIDVCIAFYWIASQCIALYCIVLYSVQQPGDRGWVGHGSDSEESLVRATLQPSEKQIFTDPSDAIGTFSILFVHVHLAAQFDLKQEFVKCSLNKQVLAFLSLSKLF